MEILNHVEKILASMTNNKIREIKIAKYISIYNGVA